MHFTGIHTDFLGAKVGACITSAYGKSDSKWPLKSVCKSCQQTNPSSTNNNQSEDPLALEAPLFFIAGGAQSTKI